MTLQEVELRRKASMIYVQALGVGRAAGWPFGDAVITEKYYAFAILPGGKSGYTESVQKGKEVLLHRVAPRGRAPIRAIDHSGKVIQPGFTTQALGKAA